MPRGGFRPGAGAKPTWKHGKTKVVRIPEALVEQILAITRELDETGEISVTQSSYENVTRSKIIDLSGVLVRSLNGQPVIHLADLIRIGYTILPSRLEESVRIRSQKKEQSRVKAIQQELDIASESILPKE